MHVPQHVAPALMRLGGGVMVSSIFVAACLVVQMLVFGFVHFTNVRFEAAPADVDQEPLKVVSPKPADPAEVAGRKPNIPIAKTPAAALEPRVPSRWDGVLRNFGDTGAWIGAVSCLCLFSQLGLSVAIAGGAAAPGVDRVVSAFNWGTLVVLGSMPLQALFPSFPTVGVFTSYEVMAAASERTEGGSDVSLIISIVAIPFVALFALVYANLRLRAGIHAGILVNSVSQLDERIEEELRRVRSEGVGSNIGPRAVGVIGAPLGAAAQDSTSAASLKRDVDDLVRGRRPI